MSVTVLLVEDEQEIRELIRAALESEGFRVFESPNGDRVIDQLNAHKPDIMLLDQLLPGKLGTDVIREVRENSLYARLPIIIVTGCDSEEEKVQGLAAGADDYVTKPFSRKELIARTRAILRRIESMKTPLRAEKLEDGNLIIDLAGHRALCAGAEVPLTLTEFNILCELMTQRGRVLSRQDLCERVLGRTSVTDRTIDVHVAALRKKLGQRGDDIQTVRGVGYRFGA